MLMGVPCLEKWTFGKLPTIRRNRVEICSTLVRVLFGKCSSAVRVVPEQHPKLTRRSTEGVPNQSRSGLEARPKDTRTVPEETGGFLAVF
ncbi:hypothetical protein [Sphingobacterium arenae]|uniref:Uncharacterized protein n=1 Tax=Sphingobacterium arenae TaxID=1280598 RepID=A0ABR7Y486_9SPHI|nr:hypothetical protein [Sphingobacterium arenae]MBD1426076.1 hypothetical protein [Sphingobacterium arenae]